MKMFDRLFGKEEIASKSTAPSSVMNPTPVVSAVRPSSEVVPTQIQKQVEAIIESEELSKLRYFLMEVIRRNTGISTPTVENKYGKISVKIPGRFNNEGSISRMVLKKALKQEAVDEKTISLENCTIQFESGYLNNGFEVQLKGKFDETTGIGMRDFFEQIFLPEYVVNEKNTLNSTMIRQLLELSDKDYVLLDEKSLELILPQEKEILIDDTILDGIVKHINNSIDEYSLKFKSSYPTGPKTLSVHWLNKQHDCKIEAGYKDGNIVIKIFKEFSAIELDRKFIEVVLKKYVHMLSTNVAKKRTSLERLKDYGVLVYEKNTEDQKSLEDLYREEGFVGYEDIKKQLEINIIKPWQFRENYIEASSKKFPNVKNVIPNTALFEGPPGTGKTTQAKIIGKYLGYPFIYIPIGKLMSKWYGESEGRLDAIFELSRKAAEENGGVIVMIDEIDEIGKNRDEAHEATGRMTGVLLKKLDGIEKVGNLLLIGSTNRKDSMDSALLSRFSRQVFFRLPEVEEIRSILEFYIPEANKLSDSVIENLKGKSGRDLKNISEDVARKYLDSNINHKEDPNVEMILLDYIEGSIKK